MGMLRREFGHAIVLAITVCGFAMAAAGFAPGAETTPPFDGPRMNPGIAVPTEDEARAGLSSELAPIQRRAGRTIRREAMLVRRLLLAYVEDKGGMPVPEAVKDEVARIRTLPPAQVFGCCTIGTFDQHLAERYMTPEDFRETIAVDLGLRRVAEAEWNTRMLAAPEAKAKRLTEADEFYRRSLRRVWIMLFRAPEGDSTALTETRGRAEKAARRLADGTAWEDAARDSDNRREGLGDGYLGLVPSWRSLTPDHSDALWRKLEAGQPSEPHRALGGGWLVAKWMPPTDDDLLEVVRDEDVEKRVSEWRMAAYREAAQVLGKSPATRVVPVVQTTSPVPAEPPPPMEIAEP